ncbi:hypothetical protein B9473_019660 [Klebsiella quasipneumoniae subsp. quasipneumoniae]|nr:hypothetical protein B9473_019660 [Klebsiella quasipneumoniae subsp. quasipneumoniae]
MPHKSPGWRRAAPYPGYSALSGGWLTPYPAYGRLLNLSYQTVAQLCRPAQAQRRRASCIRPTFPFFNASIAPAGGSPQPPLPPPSPHNETVVYCLL